MRIKKFEKFTENNKVNEAYKIINENIAEFDSKEIVTNTDVDELSRIKTDVLSKYDLPETDIANIKARISDAISKKLPSPEIKNKFK